MKSGLRWLLLPAIALLLASCAAPYGGSYYGGYADYAYPTDYYAYPATYGGVAFGGIDHVGHHHFGRDHFGHLAGAGYIGVSARGGHGGGHR